MFNPYEARFLQSKSTAENVCGIWMSYFTTGNPWVLGQLIPVWYDYVARLQYAQHQNANEES